MGRPMILHDNFLTATGVIRSDSGDHEANFGSENMVDGRTNTQCGFKNGSFGEVTFDLGSSKTINCIGVARHNLKSSKGLLKVFSSTVGTSGPWTARQRPGGYEVFGNSNAGDDSTVFNELTEFTAQYIKIEFDWLAGADANSITYVGLLSLGYWLEIPIGMPVGFIQPRWGDRDEFIVNRSIGNEFVGMAVTEKPRQATIEFRNIDVSWFDTYWDDFVTDMKKAPFFFLWNIDDRPEEAMLCWPMKRIEPPKYTKKTRCSVSLKVEGLII